MEDEEDSPAPQSRTAFVARFFNQVHFYKKLLLKYWWIPCLTLALSLGIEWLVLKHVPPTFVSEGRMIVNARLSLPNANVYNEELAYFYGTQIALMQSESVLGRVNLLLNTNPVAPRRPPAIDVTLSPRTSIFNLRAVGPDAGYVHDYLQAAMEEYIKLKKDLLATTTTATQSSMEEELNQLGKELAKSKQDQDDFQTSNSVVLLQEKGGNYAAAYSLTLNQRLAELNSELLLLKTETLDQNLERLRDNPNPKSSASNAVPSTGSAPAGQASAQAANANSTPSNLGGFKDAYLETKQRLTLLKAQRDDLSKFLDTNALDLVTLNKQIGDQEKLLEIYKQQSEEELTNRQVNLQIEIASLTNQIAEWDQKALNVSKQLTEFESLKENHQRLQTLYDQLQASLQTLDVNKGISQESVSILEPAGPGVPVPPETRKHLLMAGLIGVVLGLGILLFISLLNDRPSTFSELEQLFDLPVLGQIPLVKSKDKAAPPILQPEDDRFPLIESYRSLRSALLYKDAVKGEPARPPRSIVIASAYPSEGKSTTSANFAITLAHAGARVLLIDGDLHRGMLHECFSAGASPGLGEVLAGTCAWTNAVVTTEIPNLYLLPRGTAPRKAGNLFAKAGQFLALVGDQYDFYIFDSAPVLMADDVLSLAPHADALMLVVRAGFTSGRIAKAALDLLRLRRINTVGLVFNAVPLSTSDYYNYRSREYYQQNTAAA
jgi:capsular exopolysaccharide synthesis family protein